MFIKLLFPSHFNDTSGSCCTIMNFSPPPVIPISKHLELNQQTRRWCWKTSYCNRDRRIRYPEVFLSSDLQAWVSPARKIIAGLWKSVISTSKSLSVLERVLCLHRMALIRYWQEGKKLKSWKRCVWFYVACWLLFLEISRAVSILLHSAFLTDSDGCSCSSSLPSDDYFYWGLRQRELLISVLLQSQGFKGSPPLLITLNNRLLSPL